MRTPSIIQTTVLGVAAALALSVTSQAAESSTPVIGYYKQPVAAGVSTLVAGLVTKKEFQGKSTAVTAGASSVITCTHTGNFTTNPSYVELLDDPATVPVESYAGIILDITANNGSTITVSGNLTGFGSAINFAVRKHTTLVTLLPAGSGANDYDGLSISKDVAGVGVESSYYFEGGHWKDASLLPPNDVVDNVVVYPGQGFVYTAADVTTLTFGGGVASYVKGGNTVVPLYTTIPNLAGPVNPLVGLPPGSPTGVNTWPVLPLAGFLSDYDGIDVYPANGSGVPSSYYVEGGHIKDATLLPPNDIVDTVTAPVGSSVVISAGADVTVSFPPVTVAP